MRGTIARKITLLAAASAVAAVTLGACGSGNQAGPAANNPAAGNPAGNAGNTSNSVTNVAQLASLVADKTSTNTTAHVQFSADTGASGAMTGTGEVRMDGTNTGVDMTMSTPIGEMDMVLAGQTMYMKLPPSVLGQLNLTKPWVKIDANGTDPLSKAFGAMLSQEQQSMNPGDMLSKIKEYATIRQVSQDTVDGQPATHYALSVDTQKMMNSSAITDQMRQSMRSLGVKLPATIPYDLWVNAQSLPVKFAMTEPVSSKQGSQTATVTITFTDWGAPVNITAPPADQVGPLPTR